MDYVFRLFGKSCGGGEAMIRAAMANGIDTVFGIPGAQIYPLFDAIHRLPGINAVISRHEQGAGYMVWDMPKQPVYRERLR